MSIVNQVMQHYGQFEQKTIQEKLDLLTSKLQEMTVEVHHLAESKYVNFEPQFANAKDLETRVESLQTDIKEIQERINNNANNSQVSFSTGEFQNLNTKLSESKAVYDVILHLHKIMTLLKESEMAIENKSFYRAATAIKEAETELALTDNNDMILILVALKKEILVQKNKLDCTLSDLWKSFVKWNIKTDNKTTTQGQNFDGSSDRETSVCVSCTHELRELVKGLHHENLLIMQMKAFAKQFMNFVIPLVVENPDLLIKNLSLDGGKTRTIKLVDKASHSTNSKTSKCKSPEPESEKAYIMVFANFMSILEELDSMLLSAEFYISDTSSTTKTLMCWLGEATSSEVLELLQKTVVAKAIPSSAKDLDGFKDVVATVKLVHDKLVGLGYIQSDNTALPSYVENVNMLFSNKKSQLILVEARDLMTSDLHDSVAVTDDKPMGEWPPLTPGGVKKVKRLEVAAEHQLSDNTFRMPRCRISCTVQTLITLAYETLAEATESSQECSLQMYLAVRSMFMMFCGVVPTHHGKSLETFPQIAALHHNNCMFLAHHLMTLGHQFTQQLPHINNAHFMDLIHQIRENGVSIFLNQLSRQKELLLECLEGAQGFGQLEDKSRRDAAEKSMKQVLLQLDHLHKIWKPILPINNYKKAMGRLINCVVEHLTDSVVALEDIAQTAGQALLENILSPLEERFGEMLISPGESATVELTRHVMSWVRLAELRLVLNSSLTELGERWSEGKGPLAAAFKPSEIKQLARALFQNTDRRAALLATIK